jgi:hypothetical protein
MEPIIYTLTRICSVEFGRIVGPEAMKFGWQRLHGEYAKQFGIEMPNWPPQAAQKSCIEVIMNQGIVRSIFRWIHLVFSIPILGYIYSPFDKIPSYAPATRFVFVPVMVLSGLWMWKGPWVRRLISRRSA